MHKIYTLKYLLSISMLWYFSEGMFAPLYSLFAQKVGGDILEIASAYAIFQISHGILYIIFGKFIDKTKSEDLMLFCGYLLNTAMTFYLIFVDSIWELFLVEIVIGISMALSTPSYNSLYTKALEQGHFAEQWSYNDGGSYVISGIALFFGGVLIAYFGWNMLFIIMGSIELVATFLIGLNVDKWKFQMRKGTKKRDNEIINVKLINRIME